MSFVYQPTAEQPRLIHHDDQILVVEKPAGLLSVPGRGEDRADCLIARLIADIRRYERPEWLEYEGTSQGFHLILTLQLMALAKGRTRLSTGFEVKPRTLGARLLVQSAKLGRGNLERRYDERVKAFARAIEAKAGAAA